MRPGRACIAEDAAGGGRKTRGLEPHEAILRRAPMARRNRSTHRGADQFVGRRLPKRQKRVGVDAPKAAGRLHDNGGRQAVGRRPHAAKMALPRAGRMSRMRIVVLTLRGTLAGLDRLDGGSGRHWRIIPTVIHNGETALAVFTVGAIRNGRTRRFLRLARQAPLVPCERHGARRAGDEIRQQAGK